MGAAKLKERRSAENGRAIFWEPVCNECFAFFRGHLCVVLWPSHHPYLVMGLPVWRAVCRPGTSAMSSAASGPNRWPRNRGPSGGRRSLHGIGIAPTPAPFRYCLQTWMRKANLTACSLDTSALKFLFFFVVSSRAALRSDGFCVPHPRSPFDRTQYPRGVRSKSTYIRVYDTIHLG